MLIVPTTLKSVSIRSFVEMNLHSDCHAVGLLSINMSTLIKIVISRFLERPQSEVAGTNLFTGACPNKIARQLVRSLEFQNTQFNVTRQYNTERPTLDI